MEKYYHDGHVREIAEYCEADVLNTHGPRVVGRKTNSNRLVSNTFRN